MGKKIGYSPISLLAAGCGWIASFALTKNAAVSASAAVHTGEVVNAVIGGIELNDEEKTIKAKLDDAMVEAWSKIDNKYRLSLYADDCLSELKQEIMGPCTSVDEFISNVERKGLQSSFSIVIQKILKKHRDLLNKDPEIVWDDLYTISAADDMAAILIDAFKSVIEDDNTLKILSTIQISENKIIRTIHEEADRLLSAYEKLNI